jgi:hypothetical protein
MNESVISNGESKATHRLPEKNESKELSSRVRTLIKEQHDRRDGL